MPMSDWSGEPMTFCPSDSHASGSTTSLTAVGFNVAYADGGFHSRYNIVINICTLLTLLCRQLYR